MMASYFAASHPNKVSCAGLGTLAKVLRALLL